MSRSEGSIWSLSMYPSITFTAVTRSSLNVNRLYCPKVMKQQQADSRVFSSCSLKFWLLWLRQKDRERLRLWARLPTHSHATCEFSRLPFSALLWFGSCLCFGWDSLSYSAPNWKTYLVSGGRVYWSQVNFFGCIYQFKSQSCLRSFSFSIQVSLQMFGLLESWKKYFVHLKSHFFLFIIFSPLIRFFEPRLFLSDHRLHHLKKCPCSLCLIAHLSF